MCSMSLPLTKNVTRMIVSMRGRRPADSESDEVMVGGLPIPNPVVPAEAGSLEFNNEGGVLSLKLNQNMIRE